MTSDLCVPNRCCRTCVLWLRARQCNNTRNALLSNGCINSDDWAIWKIKLICHVTITPLHLLHFFLHIKKRQPNTLQKYSVTDFGSTKTLHCRNAVLQYLMSTGSEIHLCNTCESILNKLYLIYMTWQLLSLQSSVHVYDLSMIYVYTAVQYTPHF